MKRYGMFFEGKVCIITGAGTGIGAALAAALLAVEARVVLMGRRFEMLEKVAQQSGCPENALCIRGDVSRYSELQKVVQETMSAWGQLDVLFNNAGVGMGGALTDLSPDEVKYCIRVNLTAPMWLSQLVLPHMESSGGVIVNVSSLGGLVPLPYNSLYCATKAGLTNFSRSLEREKAATNIQMVTIHPGTVYTEMLRSQPSPEVSAQSSGLTPLHPDDVAAQILRAIAKGKRMVLVASRRERSIGYLQRWLPWLVDLILRRMHTVIREEVKAGTEFARRRNPHVSLGNSPGTGAER